MKIICRECRSLNSECDHDTEPFDSDQIVFLELLTWAGYDNLKVPK